MRFLLFLLLLPTSLTIASTIEVSVDRNLINLNESFDITFSSDKDPNTNPDFSPLEKQFEILSKNHKSAISWVNGQRTMKIQWALTVMAKKAGELEIPALSFGSEQSPALSITVNKNKLVPSTVYKNNAPIFLEVEATPLKPYLQSQVIYTIRFFSRVNIVDARLTNPKLADAVVEKLGQDKNYKTERAGMAYEVTERRYAIFPQKSGSMVIEPLALTAAVLTDNNNSRFTRFFDTQSTQREDVKSKAITLEVQAIPAHFAGKHWLAAKEVNLSQQWSGDYKKMQVGEPLTRTLTLIVNGSTIGKLPKLQQAPIEQNLKFYPDQPKLTENKTTAGIIAFREEKIAFIPSKDGKYSLPEVSVDWFNIETGKMQTATLPQMQVTVTGEKQSAKTETEIETETNVAVNNSAVYNTLKPETKIFTSSNRIWQGLSLFFALAWLITLFIFFKKKTRPQSSTTDKKAISLRSSIKALKHACNTDDAPSAKQALLVWGQLKYGTNSLSSLAEYGDTRFREQILILNQSLYGQSSIKWQGKALFQQVSDHKYLEKVASKKMDDKLEPLYRI